MVAILPNPRLVNAGRFPESIHLGLNDDSEITKDMWLRRVRDTISHTEALVYIVVMEIEHLNKETNESENQLWVTARTIGGDTYSEGVLFSREDGDLKFLKQKCIRGPNPITAIY